MRERMAKSDFINKLRTQIEHNKLLVNVFNTTFQDVLNSFDGKVYNKRFINALNDKIQAVNPLLFVRVENEPRQEYYSNYPDLYCLEITINCYLEKWNYTNKESLRLNVVLNKEYRIEAEKSLNEKYTLIWRENFDTYAEEKQQVIKNYAKYIKVAQKVADAIKEFSELPFDFRNNIEFRNKFYLNG